MNLTELIDEWKAKAKAIVEDASTVSTYQLAYFEYQWATKPAAMLAHIEQVESMIKALKFLAALDDDGANQRLRSIGSYAMFDEPAAVQTARTCLTKLGVKV